MSKGTKLSVDTVNKMVAVLQQVRPNTHLGLFAHWYWVGLNVLGLSVDKLKRMTNDCVTDEQRLQVLVTFWLLHCPYASWRLLIWTLEEVYVQPGAFGDDHRWLDKAIYKFIEPQTDGNFNVENLMSLLKTVDLETLEYCLYLPCCQRMEIDHQCKTEEEKRRAIVRWCVECSSTDDFPQLACTLLIWEQGDTGCALKKVLDYVQRVTEPTLTLRNISDVFQHVDDYHWRFGGLPNGLMIPHSKKEEIEYGYSTLSERKTALLKYFVEEHPCPSWRIAANAAYMEHLYESLERIQRVYLHEINLQELCVQVIASSLPSTDDVDSLPLPVALKSSIRTQLFVNNLQHHFNA